MGKSLLIEAIYQITIHVSIENQVATRMIYNYFFVCRMGKLLLELVVKPYTAHLHYIFPKQGMQWQMYSQMKVIHFPVNWQN